MSRPQQTLQQSIEFPSQSEDFEVVDGSLQSTALEAMDFPFEQLSDIAQVESWRKEINRPIYHVHKWWAQRLGTVFRSIVIAACSPARSDVMDLFYKPVRFPKAVVFDPFMGSGTTIGEALKLGCRAIGRDINPVAHFLVRTALAKHSREDVLAEYRRLEADISEDIRSFYRTELEDGSEAEVLYYFWVKSIDCPACSSSVDLFSKYIFASHAYRKKYPTSRCVCPKCGEVSDVRYDAIETACPSCSHAFNPQEGPAKGQKS